MHLLTSTHDRCHGSRRQKVTPHTTFTIPFVIRWTTDNKPPTSNLPIYQPTNLPTHTHHLMSPTTNSTRVPRLAAWIWIGFLISMLFMDLILYAPQVQRQLGQNAPVVQQPLPNQQQPLPNQSLPPLQQNPNQQNQPSAGPQRMWPVFLYYISSFAVALLFLLFTYWDIVHDNLGKLYYPFLILIISAAPILINALVVPRFPPGPLSNAEGMALRQMPVLFVALALTAWEYKFPHIIFFSIGISVLEIGLTLFSKVEFQNISIFFFIAVIRSISFIALGILINLLVAQLKQQGESLQQANVNLANYASTLEQLAESRERYRLARELHDTLAHTLTALTVSLETAKAYFDIDLDKAREKVDSSLDTARHGAEETRRALKALRSSNLEDVGLRAAIERAAQSAATRLNLNLTLDLQDPMPSLRPDIEQTIFRIAREAIENIANHSKAKNFSAHLHSGEQTTLIIQDDGIGFDVHSREPTGHFGLVGMRERAELVGGRLTIESEKGKGTKVVLKI